MAHHFKAIGIFLLTLLFIFAVLDFFNLTAWLIYPVSCVTGKNPGTTAALGNVPAVLGASSQNGG
jgi:hypothetical protein